MGRALVTLIADAAVFTASRNPVATRNHVACCSSEQEWAEHWTTLAVPEEYGRIQAPVLAQRLARPANWCGCSCSNPVRIDHQYWRKGTHAGVSQWSQWENQSFHSFLSRQKVRSMKGVSFAMLKAEQAWAWQTPQTLFWEDCFVAASLPGIMLPVPLPRKNEQGIEHLLSCRKNTSTC